jgi:hypothetical protein
MSTPINDLFVILVHEVDEEEAVALLNPTYYVCNIGYGLVTDADLKKAYVFVGRDEINDVMDFLTDQHPQNQYETWPVAKACETGPGSYQAMQLLSPLDQSNG